VHSVTGAGTPLLTAILMALGTNCNCGLQGMMQTNVDINLNSVTTTPTLGDYAAAAVGMFLNGIYNFATSFAPPGAALPIVAIQNVADILGRLNVPVAPWILDPYTQLIGKAQEAVQKYVDGHYKYA
jgi:hypothetical protein